MRTTVTFEPDVAAAIEARKRENGAGVSEIVNELVREGLVPRPPRKPFKHTVSKNMGKPLVDITNVWKAIEQIEGPNYK